MRDALMHIEITDVAGVFAVRQAGRQVAAAMGLAPHDRVRVAIALSELGRELFSRFSRVSAAFLLERDGDPGLVIEFGFEPPPGADLAGEGFSAAARLMDLVEEDGRGDLFLVRARKKLPAGVAGITDRKSVV